MGYYTRYELSESHDGGATWIDGEACARLGEVSGYGYPLDDEYKWYDHEAHARQVSAEFPDVVIRIKGEGEESGDIWVAYACRGEWQCNKARIVLDEPDLREMGVDVDDLLAASDKAVSREAALMSRPIRELTDDDKAFLRKRGVM